MEDVVAIEVATPAERHYFLTWGRIFDAPTDEEDLLKVVNAFQPRCGIDEKDGTSRVCATLQEAAQAPYFFEGLVYFGQRPIPFGDGYQSWRTERRKEMEAGREIWYVGAVQ